MKKYLLPVSNDPAKLKIELRSHAPAGGVLAPDGEDAEWLEIVDDVDEFWGPKQAVDGNGDPVTTTEQHQQVDGVGNVIVDENGDPILIDVQVPVWELDGNGDPVQELKSSEVVGKKATVNEVTKTQVLADRATAQAQKDAEDALRGIVVGAIDLGRKVMEDFIMENVQMGITADGMSETVLDALAPVDAALRTGTLNVAISRIKAMPVESKDVKYITDARLLAVVNKIETALGLTLSGTL